MANEYIRKTFVGSAPPRTLVSSISASATSFELSNPNGWPTTTMGPFVAVIDRGTASEEIVLVGTRGVATCSNVQRGYDGSTAQLHAAGATVEHCIDGYTMHQLSAMANAATAQYDLVMRGALGNSWSRIAAGSAGQALVISGGVPVFGQVPTAGIADAAVTAAKQESSLPRGTMGYAAVTANQTGITTMTDLTGLSVTWTAVAGRRYKVSFKVLVFSTVANDDANVWIRNGSSTSLNAFGVRAVSTTHGIAVSGVHPITGLSAGSQTVKLSLERAAGSGAVAIAATATHPSFILVEDIGT